MFNEFAEYCSNVIGLKSGDKILLTVSGGADSMVMLHLFERSDYELSVAHCNFNLRGEESERDTTFVKDYCDSNDIRLFVKYFNTVEFAAENGISVQMAARDLRYRWFEQLRQKLDYDYIATAHHLDDQA
jgi:tRNA(Ile)-lysidine synthase